MECKGLSQKAAELQACINNAGGVRLQDQKKLVSNLSAEADSISSDIATSGVKAASHRKQVAKLEKEVTKSKDELAAIDSEAVKIEVQHPCIIAIAGIVCFGRRAPHIHVCASPKVYRLSNAACMLLIGRA